MSEYRADDGTPAQILRAMADRVEKNDPADFAGCLVIIPPLSMNREMDVPPVEILLIDPAQDMANFWSTVTAKIRIENDKFLAQAQNVPPLGGYSR